MEDRKLEHAMDIIFRLARTHRKWQDRPVEERTLQEAWELAKMGPTSSNCMPLRVVFVRTADGKARLKPHLDQGNVVQTMAAPVTA
ncbi:MAG TPA: nitroreductase family protein, partial [Thermoanaerobaculaceae bacterium]|nr:nitroreductase family protein [Thermoanaerobaculaceae bacterium]